MDVINVQRELYNLIRNHTVPFSKSDLDQYVHI